MTLDLNAIMRQVWEDTGETDPRRAAKHIIDRIPEDADEELLTYLLGNAYSTFLSGISRERPITDEPDPDGTMPGTSGGTATKVRRRNAAINPGRYQQDVMRDLDSRPFYVPSLGRHTRVSFKDMTVGYWLEYAEYRRARAEGYEASARWAELNIAKLGEYGVTTSGELPDDVKRELFAGEPETADE